MIKQKIPASSISFLSRFALLCLCVLFSGCARNPLVTPVNVPQPQKAEAYFTPSNRVLMTTSAQQIAKREYLEKFFAPWDSNRDVYYFDKAKKQSVVKSQRATLKQFTLRPQWGDNFHVYPKAWFARMESNMQLSLYPLTNERAIVVKNTALRALPTNEPMFNNYMLPGEGYPFDNLQYSALWVGTPLRVVHLSQDGSWALVFTPWVVGWVSRSDIALADDGFITQWKNASLIAITKNHVNVYDNQGRARFDGRMGTLLPKKEDGVLIPLQDTDGHAVLREGRLDKAAYVNFPTPVTSARFASLINELLGEPYGWGGLYGYRDCSQTMMDIFTPFGIWLPRNSAAQLSSRPHQSLWEMKPKAKEKFILKKGKPFLTLVGLPGHIMLYVGEKDHKAIIFHDMWGLHTVDMFRHGGRGVVGKTVITTLDFGKEIPRVDVTLLDGIRTMTFLDQPLKRAP